MENKENMSKKLSEIFENHFVQYDLKFGVEMRVFKLIEGSSLTACNCQKLLYFENADIEEPWELSDVSEFNGKLDLIKLDLEEDDNELLFKIKDFEEIYQVSIFKVLLCLCFSLIFPTIRRLVKPVISLKV